MKEFLSFALSMAIANTSKTTARKRASSQTRTISVTEARRRDAVAKAAGGPVDYAVYKCSCGSEFQAAVSTSVSCPHCGTSQSW